MTDEEWRRIADRIASTWPGEAGDAERYRPELDDLDPDAVDEAIDGLLIDHRNDAPSPRAVRAAAQSGDGGEGAGDDDRPPGPPEPRRRAPEGDRQESGKATAALVLGAAGLVTLPIVLSVAAIVVGTRALSDIAATPGLGGERRAKVGRILGWLGLVAMAIVIAVAIAGAAGD